MKEHWNFWLISEWGVCQEGRVNKGVLGGHWWFLTGDMDDRVIPYVMNDVLLPQVRYPEHFALISQTEVCQEGGGSRRGVLGGHWGFLTGDMEDLVIPDVMNDVILPQGRYPENFMLMSQWEVCQEGVYLEDIEGSWPETWMTGSFLMPKLMFFYPKEHILKVSGQYLYLLWSYKRSRSKRPTSDE